MTKLEQALAAAKGNLTIVDALTKADSVINHSDYKNIVVSVSGGADSDIMLDLVERIRDTDTKITYLWFNTGMEYQATKDHLIELEEKYGIEIVRTHPKKPVPLGVREYGLPFLSKHVSQMIAYLQKNNFDWSDEPYEVLAVKYPRCTDALKWWTNYRDIRDGKDSWFSIARHKGLKEFIMQSPPAFRISDKCCKGAKKSVAHDWNVVHGVDLELVGIRKAEGGIRKANYKTCISLDTKAGYTVYRPLFWFKQADKDAYKELFGVTYSKCYTDYGFKRTGCACCPFGGKDVEKELAAIKEHEPRLYKACINVFGESYEYTRKYYAFRASMDAKERGEVSLWEGY